MIYMIHRRLTVLLMTGILVFSLTMTADAQNKEPTAIYSVDTDEKVVALTFDISWGNKYAHPILDVLGEKDVYNATFFLSGPWALKHREIVKRIDDMGFEIGTHGWKHQNYSQHSDEWIRQQVKKSEDALYDITGKRTRLIRTPNGDYNARVVRTLQGMGYQVIQWDTDSLDWMKPGKEKIVERVLSRAHPGDIILLHASDSCPQTQYALPEIIDGLREKGYKFVTVSELLKKGEPQP
ncbi:MAG: polysaccharide deacetylase family sporulation protein PdaB [Bacillaceae bacterium]|nr:polysaccharide deacetylase family sporulation protein PdaB [Bacillaceae bacterium]